MELMAGEEHTDNVDTNNIWHHIKIYLAGNILF